MNCPWITFLGSLDLVDVDSLGTLMLGCVVDDVLLGSKKLVVCILDWRL